MDAIALAMQQDDSNGVLGQVLLKGKVLIHRHKHVELGLCQIEQLAVRCAGPALTQDGLRINARNVRCKTSVDALVQQNLQAAAVTARSAAFSRKATT